MKLAHGQMTLRLRVTVEHETAEEVENFHRRLVFVSFGDLRAGGASKREAEARLCADIEAMLRSPAAFEAFENERAAQALALAKAQGPDGLAGDVTGS